MTREPEPRIRAFEKLAFGLFIHYGLYFALGAGEWAMHIKKIKHADYRRLVETFTADEFDADAYAQLAKTAGMRYMVFTARLNSRLHFKGTLKLKDNALLPS